MTSPRKRSTKSSHALGLRCRQRSNRLRSISDSPTQVVPSIPFAMSRCRRRAVPCTKGWGPQAAHGDSPPLLPIVNGPGPRSKSACQEIGRWAVARRREAVAGVNQEPPLPYRPPPWGYNWYFARVETPRKLGDLCVSRKGGKAAKTQPLRNRSVAKVHTLAKNSFSIIFAALRLGDFA